MVQKAVIGGEALDPAYEKVAQVFRASFDHGWEYEGAAFAAFVDGVPVVDVWGGFAEKYCSWPWKRDTMATIFSCTKALSSICIASLVDKGLLSYSDLVTKYWPEFGFGGKDNVTVQQVLCHQAGIPYLRDPNGSLTSLSLDQVLDIHTMERLVEQQKVQYTPGSQSGYHALTFGWIADGIFRRVEPQGRGIGQFFNEEIAHKHKLDVFIGRTAAEEYRIARITPVTTNVKNIIREAIHSPLILKDGCRKFVPWMTFAKALNNFSNICVDLDLLNNPDLRTVCIAAGNGVATARDLAKTLDLFSSGQIVSGQFFEQLREPLIIDEKDTALGFKLSKGNGFMYTRSPLGEWQIGHMGVGGQNMKTDPTRRITFAYLTNGMKAGQAERTRTMKKLEKALYDCYANAKLLGGTTDRAKIQLTN